MTLLGPIEVKESLGLYNSKTNWTNARQILEQKLKINISLKTQDEIDSAIVYFNDSVIQAVASSTPTLKMTNKENIPTYIKDKIGEKRKLRKTWQTTRHPADKTKLNKATNELKVLLTKHKERKLQNYMANLGTAASTNYSLWKATKYINGAVVHKPPIKTETGTWAKTSKEKADTLAKHFLDTFTSEMDNQNINIKSDNIINVPQTKTRKTTISEIKNQIKKINDKKAPGYDLINGKILKELPEIALQFIRNIFNCMLETKYFSRLWKIAQITAIPKPGKDATKTASYRPISLLPILSKVFEKILFDRLQPILTAKKVIPSHQFGFRRQHSTVQQIHRVVNKILNDMNDKKYCVAVYLDIAKAFDKVWHKGLLHKLQRIFPQNYYELLKSYIIDRKFYIRFEDEYSDILQMTAGVPQGSVLGPLLYLIYTADVPTPTTHNAMIATFADDTVLMASNNDEKLATFTLQKLINNTVNWFDEWGIEVNKDKTIQVIYTNKKTSKYNLTLKNNKIKICPAAKYLGITIDEKLTWKQHIIKKRNEIKNKYRQLNWLIGRASKLSLYNKVLIYKTIITPIWKYGIEIWGTAKNTNLQLIQRTQSKILRNITNASWFISNEALHRDLNVDTIQETITKCSTKHIQRLSVHQNEQMRKIVPAENIMRRLKRLTPTDLTIRFTV